MKEEQCAVWIELHKIQSYIFNSPILKVMSGANSLIGELMFWKLPELAMVEKGENCDFLDEANPAEDFKHGIYNRFGGHLQIVFENQKKAEAYANKAVDLIEESAPGLSFECFMFPIKTSFKETDACRIYIQKGRGYVEGIDPKDYKPERTPNEPVLSEWLATCEWTGQGVATDYIDVKKKRVSKETLLKYEQGLNFDKDKVETQDPLRKLEQQFLEQYHQKSKRDITNFHDLVARYDDQDEPRGNLALIKIDGNKYGNHFKAFLNNLDKSGSYAAVSLDIENFWHKARVTMSDALCAGITEALKTPNKYINYPFRVLMLGGDDLFLVCAASMAFPFLLAFEKSFRNHQLKHEQMSFSCGLLITPATFPFHAANELAEDLLTSAKVASRKDKEGKNWLDWHILKSGHTTSLNEIRKREYQVDFCFESKYETLLLTQRPYPISQGTTSLDNLYNNNLMRGLHQESDGPHEARRKKHGLNLALRQGRVIAEMAFKETFRKPMAWASKEINGENHKLWITDLADLFEIDALATEENPS